MPPTSRQRVGKWGETIAAAYLERRGYRVLARNVRTPYGEIDLLARQPAGSLVFVEVKTRTGGSFGYPEEAVDARKLQHLVASAQAYVAGLAEEAEPGWRIDVIAIQGRPGGKVEDVRIEHFENIAA
jgi:putative endonuclease